MSSSEIKVWIENSLDKKVSVARNLYEGNCGGSYIEAAIILASVISGMAAEAWPGRGIDRKRFVELCIQHSKSDLETKKISILLLKEHLHDKGNQNGVSAIENILSQKNFHRTDLTTSDKIDLYENEILQAVTIDTKDLRRFSYANLFYEEIRCSFAHEIKIGKYASSMPMGTIADRGYKHVSYTNERPYPRIHFHYEWIEQVVLSIAESLKKNPQNVPYPHPSRWWIEG